LRFAGGSRRRQQASHSHACCTRVFGIVSHRSCLQQTTHPTQGRASTQREFRSACNDSCIERNIRAAYEFAIHTPRSTSHKPAGSASAGATTIRYAHPDKPLTSQVAAPRPCGYNTLIHPSKPPTSPVAAPRSVRLQYAKGWARRDTQIGVQRRARQLFRSQFLQ
jgi:hypothetical protein